MKKVSIIIPSYNEEENISKFFEMAENTLIKDFDYQYIFINDGSQDQTAQEIQKLIETKQNKEIIGLNFSRNFGKESAILAGLEHADGDYVSLIDADMQQHPKYVNQMLNLLENDADLDIVACYQEKRKEGCFISSLKGMFYHLINKMSDIKFKKNTSDFRTFRKSVADAILDMPEYNRFSKGIFSWIGFNTKFIPYTVEKRQYGKTSWSFSSLVKYAIDGFFGFSIVPLRIATLLGIFTSIAALIYFIIVLIQKLFIGIDLQGYPTIVSLILLLSGVQLICMGIIGEYLGRTYLETKKRPNYIVKSIYKTETAKSLEKIESNQVKNEKQRGDF